MGSLTELVIVGLLAGCLAAALVGFRAGRIGRGVQAIGLGLITIVGAIFGILSVLGIWIFLVVFTTLGYLLTGSLQGALFQPAIPDLLRYAAGLVVCAGGILLWVGAQVVALKQRRNRQQAAAQGYSAPAWLGDPNGLPPTGNAGGMGS